MEDWLLAESQSCGQGSKDGDALRAKTVQHLLKHITSITIL